MFRKNNLIFWFVSLIFLISTSEVALGEDWEPIFERLDTFPKSVWQSAVTVKRSYPYNDDGTITIRVSEITKILTENELSLLELKNLPYTILLLRFENDTIREVPIFMSSAECFVLIDSKRQSYEAINPKAVISNIMEYLDLPLTALDNSVYYNMTNTLHAGARAYMTLVFPKVDNIKQLNISENRYTKYSAILKF